MQITLKLTLQTTKKDIEQLILMKNIQVAGGNNEETLLRVILKHNFPNLTLERKLIEKVDVILIS